MKPDPFFAACFGEQDSAAPGPRKVAVSTLDPYRFGFENGTKFPGGYGPTEVLITDYWTLRQRSAALFETNLYARGIIRRLITNEINVGLHLEATPDEGLLGKKEDSLSDWSETVETRFALWARSPWLCDQRELDTFGALQAAARMEALIAGDVLVVLRQDQRTKLPRIQLIRGDCVQTPMEYAFGNTRGGNKIVHGVELDSNGRQVAYWIRQPDGTTKRLAAMGEKSGRRLAWLVYGTEQRLDAVRGKPLLSLILQSLKEIDRYRDSVQRKAVINAMIAVFIKKTEDKPGTRAMTNASLSRRDEPAVDTAGNPRTFRIAEQVPGIVMEELQTGEEPSGFNSNGTDEKFGDFEAAIIQAVAWNCEMPPEILRLSFNNNYSASQAAINEFKMYLNRVRMNHGENFCQPVYEEWMVAEVLSGKITAQGLLEAWRSNAQYDIYGAWTNADWTGQIKPAVDLSKLVGGYDALIAGGHITHDRAARELTGTKFSQNVRKLRRENEQLVEASRPLLELKQLTSGTPKPSTEPELPDSNSGAVSPIRPKALHTVAPVA